MIFLWFWHANREKVRRTDIQTNINEDTCCLWTKTKTDNNLNLFFFFIFAFHTYFIYYLKKIVFDIWNKSQLAPSGLVYYLFDSILFLLVFFLDFFCQKANNCVKQETHSKWNFSFWNWSVFELRLIVEKNWKNIKIN